MFVGRYTTPDWALFCRIPACCHARYTCHAHARPSPMCNGRSNNNNNNNNNNSHHPCVRVPRSFSQVCPVLLFPATAAGIRGASREGPGSAAQGGRSPDGAGGGAPVRVPRGHNRGRVLLALRATGERRCELCWSVVLECCAGALYLSVVLEYCVYVCACLVWREV